jgi:N-methylhydantoinase B/oxoprolinase/acetone carboxylase alpha subunit
MAFIQANAEAAVRDMLRDFSAAQGLPEVGRVAAEDQLDDGSPIRLAVTIDRWVVNWRYIVHVVDDVSVLCSQPHPPGRDH